MKEKIKIFFKENMIFITAITWNTPLLNLSGIKRNKFFLLHMGN